MNNYFTEFYTNWNKKVELIEGDELPQVYDRFMTLFVIYNNLYNQIPDFLRTQRITVPKQIYDNKAATEIVVNLIGAENILSSLSESGLDDDIETIIDLIEQEVFHIKLNHGEYKRSDDLKILAELKSLNNTKKTIAILKVIYHVRCNIFHGSKDFQEYQRLLVEPLTNILRVMNQMVFDKLNE